MRIRNRLQSYRRILVTEGVRDRIVRSQQCGDRQHRRLQQLFHPDEPRRWRICDARRDERTWT